jgi:hypothetical protein
MRRHTPKKPQVSALSPRSWSGHLVFVSDGRPGWRSDRVQTYAGAVSRYTVHLEAREEATDEAISALMDAIEEHGGVAVGGPGFRTWSVTLTVEADTPMEAVSRGASAVSGAASISGLGVSEFVHCEAGLLSHDLARYPRK